MIWLISYPRSGNTFFRNVLFEVYGIKSSTFHVNEGRELDKEWDKFPVIKTHELPYLVPEDLLGRAVVYIVRDGRDSVVSSAHHTLDLGKSEKSFDEVLEEIILARNDSYFGGWSKNVLQWIPKSSIVIRFEDLIKDPIACCERLRPYLDLPEPDLDKLPSFEDLKFGLPKYGGGGGGRRIPEALKRKRVQISFRRGKVGGWKDDMSEKSLALFWNHHGETMRRLGYMMDGEIKEPHPILESVLCEKLTGRKAVPTHRKILVEASKLLETGNDGVKRYQLELLKEFQNIEEEVLSFDLLLEGRCFPLKRSNLYQLNKQIEREIELEKAQMSLEDRVDLMPYEQNLLRLKQQIREKVPVGLYKSGAIIYRSLPFRKGLDAIRNHVFKKKIKAKLEAAIEEDEEEEYTTDVNSEHYSIPLPKEQILYDLIHIPLPQHAHWFRKWPIPKVVTIHDLTHVSHHEFHTGLNLLNCKYGFNSIRKDPDTSCVAISESTRQDLIDLDPKLPERSCVIYESASAAFKKIRDDEESALLRSKYELPHKPYLLCLSTIEPRKNIPNTINAFVKMMEDNPDLDCALFVCGKHGWMSEKLIEEAKIKSENIILTGFIDDEDLPRLYNDARALCYLSFYEGFGLPPVEAMRCGTPVLYGNNSSMPEVIQDGGIPLPPDDIPAIASAMKKILTDDQFYQELSFKALKRSNDFSWRKTAEEHLDLFLQHARKLE